MLHRQNMRRSGSFAGVPDSFLILHGMANHRPPDHWQFWLAAALAERGHRVLYPDLPHPDAPRLALWEDVLHDHLTQLVDSRRTVICHSLSCLLWFKAAASIGEDDRPDRLLLVSPPASHQVPEAGAELRIEAFDAVTVSGSVRGQIRVVCSDDDPYNTQGAQTLYAEPLGVVADVVPGAEHITPNSGYGPWPWAADWADPAGRCA